MKGNVDWFMRERCMQIEEIRSGHYLSYLKLMIFMSIFILVIVIVIVL